MASFVAASLVAPKGTGGDVAVSLGAVVAGKDNQSVLDQLLARTPGIVGDFQPVQHASKSDVVFVNEVVPFIRWPAGNGSGRAVDDFAANALIGRIWAVVGIGGVIEKERFLPIHFVRQMPL